MSAPLAAWSDAKTGRFLRALMSVCPEYFGSTSKDFVQAGGEISLIGIYSRALSLREVNEIYASFMGLAL